jgi:SAM-dependent methyltransferase
VIAKRALLGERQTEVVSDSAFAPERFERPDFFARTDASPDPQFYSWPRFVTHIDDYAIGMVGALYEELGIDGEVLDLMGSWVSHFRTAPARLTVLGLNAEELAANPLASDTVVHDLNADPRLPFGACAFDSAVCCVSVDYLTRPVEVFSEVARVLRPGGVFVCTFSNRCFPTKAIRGWLYSTDEGRCRIVESYFSLSGRWEEALSGRRTPPGHAGDPLMAVWARRSDRVVGDVAL